MSEGTGLRLLAANVSGATNMIYYPANRIYWYRTNLTRPTGGKGGGYSKTAEDVRTDEMVKVEMKKAPAVKEPGVVAETLSP